MACATAARLPFSFRPRTPQRQSNSKPTTTHIPTRLAAPKPLTNHFVPSSVDVSKEDKPMEPNQAPAVAEEEEEEEEVGQEGEFDKRRLDENFAVLNTGIYECRSCGYKYDKATGDPTYPIPAGLDFEKLPEDWRCPTCGAAKSFFVSKRVEIAGFAQNQQFGFGGNTLTSGQKAVLIYGSLLLFFALFLSGYFLQ